jgi:hypothetical protein
MFETRAKIVYEPSRAGMKRNTKWWAVADLGWRGADLIRYYQQFVEKSPGHFGETQIQLFDPSWGAHVTFARGERPRNKLNWGKLDGKIITLKYSNLVRRSGDDGRLGRPEHFFFVDVESDELGALREEYYGPNPYRTDGKWNFHMTIGRQYQESKALREPKRWTTIV